MFEALTAMVFNPLLLDIAYVLLHSLWMYDASISQFDWRLLNQTELNKSLFFAPAGFLALEGQKPEEAP